MPTQRHQAIRDIVRKFATTACALGVAVTLGVAGCAQGETVDAGPSPSLEEIQHRAFSLRDDLLDEGPSAFLTAEHQDLVLEIQALEFTEEERAALANLQEEHLTPLGLTTDDILADPGAHVDRMLEDPVLQGILLKVQESMGIEAPTANDQGLRCGPPCIAAAWAIAKAIAALIVAFGTVIGVWKIIDGVNAYYFCGQCSDDSFRSCGPASGGWQTVAKCSTGTSSDFSFGGEYRTSEDLVENGGAYEVVGTLDGLAGNDGSFSCGWQCNKPAP